MCDRRKDMDLWAGEAFVLCQASGFRVPGFLIVESRSEATRLGDLGRDAGAELLKLPCPCTYVS